MKHQHNSTDIKTQKRPTFFSTTTAVRVFEQTTDAVARAAAFDPQAEEAEAQAADRAA